MVRKLRYLSVAVRNSARRPFMRGDRLPGAIETLFPLRHGPGRMLFIQKGFAPLDQLIVDLLNNLCAERVVTPVRESDPASQSRLIAFDNVADPFLQVSLPEDARQLGRELVDESSGRIGEFGLKRLDGRVAEPFCQTGSQDVTMRQPMRSDAHLCLAGERPQHRTEILESDTAGVKVGPILMTGKITVTPHELFAAPDCLLKWEVLEAVERLVVDECPHRPILRDYFTLEMNNPAQLHASGLDVGRRNYRFHASDPVTE